MIDRLETFLGELALPLFLLAIALIFGRGLPFILGSIANG